MERNLTAVVLAGVHDWGDCPLHRATVRPLVPVANRPLIGYALSAQESAGAGHAVICANGSGPAVRSVIGDRTAGGMSIDYYEDTMPRGPAGCIRDASKTLTSEQDELIVVEASVIPGFDLSTIIETHRRTRASLTIATQCARDEDSQRPIGVYVVSPEVINLIGHSGFQDIKEGVIHVLHRAGLKVATCPVAGFAPRMQGLGAYFSMNAWVLKRAIADEQPPEGYACDDGLLIHNEARVHHSARLLGPVMIGPGAVVGQGAVIVGPTVVGEGCRIEAGTVVTRSVLWGRASVEPGAVVDRSVITSHARVSSDEHLYDTVCIAERKHRRDLLRRIFGVPPTASIGKSTPSA